MADCPGPDLLPGLDQLAFVDIDAKITEVYGPTKEGAAFGYTRKRGELPDRHTVHPVVSAGGGHPAAWRQRRFPPQRGVTAHAGAEAGPPTRRHRHHRGARGFSVLHRPGHHHHPRSGRPVLGHRPPQPGTRHRDRRHPRRRVDSDHLFPGDLRQRHRPVDEQHVSRTGPR